MSNSFAMLLIVNLQATQCFKILKDTLLNFGPSLKDIHLFVSNKKIINVKTFGERGGVL